MGLCPKLDVAGVGEIRRGRTVRPGPDEYADRTFLAGGETFKVLERGTRLRIIPSTDDQHRDIREVVPVESGRQADTVAHGDHDVAFDVYVVLGFRCHV